MKYKVFAYIGSFRGSNSITERVMYSLLENLSETYGIEFNNSIYTAKNSDIHECVGCLNCFNAGVCSLHDDMNGIKEAIKDSDIIILGSPVYFHQVSGSTKKLVDRLSYWSHILQLRGKLGIPIAVEDTNGGQFAVDYLEKFLQYTGAAVLAKVVVSAGKLSSEAAFDSVIRHYSKQVYNNLQAPAVALLQDEYYSQLRKIVSVKDKSSFERKSWDENGLFDYRSYSDLFKCHYEKHAVKVEQRG